MIEYVMYKRTPPQQKLLGVETQVSPPLRSRLESSWAHLFKCEVFPILFRNEGRYAMLYGTTGRPNFSVARLLGLCPLFLSQTERLERGLAFLLDTLFHR